MPWGILTTFEAAVFPRPIRNCIWFLNQRFYCGDVNSAGRFPDGGEEDAVGRAIKANMISIQLNEFQSFFGCVRTKRLQRDNTSLSIGADLYIGKKGHCCIKSFDNRYSMFSIQFEICYGHNRPPPRIVRTR